MSKRARVGLITGVVWLMAIFSSAALFADSYPSAYEGVPVSIGVTSSSGGIVPATFTFVNVLLKKEDGKLELLPVSINTNSTELAVKIIALINGAIKTEKPVKVYYETSPDEEKRVVAVESLGITFKLP
jgi:hypothetical protein